MTLMGGLGHATGGSANVLGRDLTGMDGDALAGIRRKKIRRSPDPVLRHIKSLSDSVSVISAVKQTILLSDRRPLASLIPASHQSSSGER